MTGTSERAYARAVEAALSRIHGRAVVLSPRDWALLASWCERGVPLAAILEALETERPSRRRRPRRPATLATVAPAIEETWDVIRSGRLAGEPDARSGRPSRAALARWSAVRERSPKGLPLDLLLERILRRLDAGDADPAAADAELDEELAGAAPADLLARVEVATDLALGPYRERMGETALAETRRRAIVDRLRRELDLPRLALAR